MQRGLAVGYRRFWTTYSSHLHGASSPRQIIGLIDLENRADMVPQNVGMFIFNYALQHFKAYCTIWVRHSNFSHQASPRVSPRESTQRRKVELWVRNVRKFCLNADFHFTFRDLLHALKLRQGTDGFTSPPKEGVLRNFLP
jgi:hypothetical protein